MNTPNWLIIHHTGSTAMDPKADTSHHTFEDVNEYHRDLWDETTRSSLGYYIGYHYFIDKSGKVTQGRADTDRGAHTIGANASSLGICMSGNFDVTKPTEAQVKSLKTLVKRLMKKYNIPVRRLVPHRKFASYKSCFGSGLDNGYVKDLILKDMFPYFPKDVIRTIRQLISIGRIKDMFLVDTFGGDMRDLGAPCYSKSDNI